jgi:hypothetical protein
VKRLAVFLAVVAVLATAPAAFAEATRTWVSGVGDDANPCSRTAPCKTWAGAISKTAAGGEIDALDPGGFGSVTITKAITLNGRGTHASILAASFNGINVQAGPGDVVTLKHLAINGDSTLAVGIHYISGKALRIRDVEAYGFSPTNGIGLLISATGGFVSVDNSYFDDSYYGIIQSGPGAKLTVTNSSIDGSSGIGVVSNGGNGSVTLRNVAIMGSPGGSATGVQTQGGARMTLDHCVITGNHVGVSDDGASYTRVSNSEITENDTGLSASNGGLILTQLNNTVIDNGTNGSFSGTFGLS